MDDREEDPLLPQSNRSQKKGHSIYIEHWLYPHYDLGIQSSRDKVKLFLASKAGHYSVLALVSLDVTGIFADFVIRLFQCEKQWGDAGWDEALDALGIVSLVFSCLFMAELMASVWAFGWIYFHSWFHCVDAVVIIAGLVIDVLLHGPLEEAASLIIILRLWRIFKIVEELSAGAQEELDDLDKKIRQLEGENRRLTQEIVQERRRLEGENGKLRNEMGQLRMRVHDRGDDNKGERSNTPPTPD